MCIPTLGLLLGRVFFLVPCVSLSVRGTAAMVAGLFVVMTAACGTIASASTCLRVSIGGWETRPHRGIVFTVTMQVWTPLPSMGITYPLTIPSVFCMIWGKTLCFCLTGQRCCHRQAILILAPLAPLDQQDSLVDQLVSPKGLQWVVAKSSHSQILMASFGS